MRLYRLDCEGQNYSNRSKIFQSCGLSSVIDCPISVDVELLFSHRFGLRHNKTARLTHEFRPDRVSYSYAMKHDDIDRGLDFGSPTGCLPYDGISIR